MNRVLKNLMQKNHFFNNRHPLPCSEKNGNTSQNSAKVISEKNDNTSQNSAKVISERNDTSKQVQVEEIAEKVCVQNEKTAEDNPTKNKENESVVASPLSQIVAESIADLAEF